MDVRIIMGIHYQILLGCVLPNHNRELSRDLTELVPQLALVIDSDDNIQPPHEHKIIGILYMFSLEYYHCTLCFSSILASNMLK